MRPDSVSVQYMTPDRMSFDLRDTFLRHSFILNEPSRAHLSWRVVSGAAPTLARAAPQPGPGRLASSYLGRQMECEGRGLAHSGRRYQQFIAAARRLRSAHD